MRREYIYMNVVAPLFILAPIILLIVRYKILSGEGKALLFYLVTDALVSIISSVLAFKHITNLPLYHVATIIETLMLLYFFYIILSTTPIAKYLKLLIFIFPLLGLLNMLYLQHIYEFNSYMLSLQAIIIVVLCLLFWLSHGTDVNTRWASVPENWIVAGFLLYFASSFVLLTFSNIIISSSRHLSIVIWNIHATLNILMYLMLCAGIKKYPYVK